MATESLSRRGASAEAGEAMTRRRSSTFKKLLSCGGLLSIFFLGLLVASIFWPIPLPILQPLVESRLSRTIAPLRLSADSLALTLDPSAGSLTLIAEDIRIVDSDGQIVASLPRGEAEVSLAALLQGARAIVAYRLHEAKVALTFEEGAGLRLAVGPYGPASEVPLLGGEAFDKLTDRVWTCALGSFPKVYLDEGLLFVIDQKAAVNLRFAVQDLAFDLQASGSRLTLSSHMLVAGQRLNFNLAADQDCKSQTVAVSILPKGVHPAVLGEVIPGGGLLYPFEVPVSGQIDLRFGAERSLLGLEFDLTGGAGSLEVASYAANNLTVEGFSLIGAYSAAEKRLTLKQGRFDLEDGTLWLGGSIFQQAEQAWLALDVVFLGEALDQLLPRWFAGLQTSLRKALADYDGVPKIGLRLEGSLDRAHFIEAQGRFFLPTQAAPSGGGSQSSFQLDFRLEGRLQEPRLVIPGQTP